MALEDSFKPKEDTGFCAWLRDDMGLSVEKVKELDYPRDIEELRKGYAEYLEKEVKVLDEHSKKLGKKYILTPENFQKLIQLTCSVEVAQAYQATAQALQATSQNQTVIQA
ncbi:11930_t:CDS:1 [Funneliformis geosporum]|uniref:16817_t:CDS:1 n=1 Tax=Funneliformis geosporum TaxID=1117311 RepID=A0A9W4SUK3_9GLOM|nr:11930_t:CDS:1 [Funneliformis geosporum]CAI2182124.1 16817_t:CDS:1 [Funneliformis geosporum]